jgi:hypothetical protein
MGAFARDQTRWTLMPISQTQTLNLAHTQFQLLSGSARPVVHATGNRFIQHLLTTSSDDDVVSRIVPAVGQGLSDA